MAIVSRKEFAEMCGDDVKTLNVYINRRKVVLCASDPKKIDTEDLANMMYKKNRIDINKARREAERIGQSIIANPRKDKSFDEDDEDNTDLSDSDKYFSSKHIADFGSSTGKSSKINLPNLEDPYIVKLKKDTELVELKIQKEQILLDKAAGKLIPIDIAASILQSQAKSIFANFDNAIENIASIYCQIMANGDMSMYSRIVEEGKRALSNAIELAGADADSDLDRLLDSFSQDNPNKLDR